MFIILARPACRRQGGSRHGPHRGPHGHPRDRGDDAAARQALKERRVRQRQRRPQAEPQVPGHGLEITARLSPQRQPSLIRCCWCNNTRKLELLLESVL